MGMCSYVYAHTYAGEKTHHALIIESVEFNVQLTKIVTIQRHARQKNIWSIYLQV